MLNTEELFRGRFGLGHGPGMGPIQSAFGLIRSIYSFIYSVIRPDKQK